MLKVHYQQRWVSILVFCNSSLNFQNTTSNFVTIRNVYCYFFSNREKKISFSVTAPKLKPLLLVSLLILPVYASFASFERASFNWNSSHPPKPNMEEVHRLRHMYIVAKDNYHTYLAQNDADESPELLVLSITH